MTPGDCPFSSDVNYTVILEEHGTGNVQKIINSNTCVRSECNASFDAPLNRSVIVKITATNEIGESPTIGKCTIREFTQCHNYTHESVELIDQFIVCT